MTATALHDLPAALRAAREREGIGLREAAERIGVSFNTLSRIERGHDYKVSAAVKILGWLDPELPRCPRDSDWCDGVICRDHGIDCPKADPEPRLQDGGE